MTNVSALQEKEVAIQASKATQQEQQLKVKEREAARLQEELTAALDSAQDLTTQLQKQQQATADKQASQTLIHCA